MHVHVTHALVLGLCRMVRPAGWRVRAGAEHGEADPFNVDSLVEATADGAGAREPHGADQGEVRPRNGVSQCALVFLCPAAALRRICLALQHTTHAKRA